MNRLKIVKITRGTKCMLLLCLLALLLPISAMAQTVKPISVSNEAPYIDHVTLKPDSKDMDLMVKFTFNETDNTFTISLISYRLLFVFRDDARYSEVVRRKKFVPKKFPYVVTADEGQKFKLSRDFLRLMPKPRKKHIFKSLLNYEGLVPVPKEYKIVNDFIEQKFDIKKNQDNVSVTLREIFLMEQDAKKESQYWIVFGKDLNTEYQITIQRNPCFGLEKETESAKKVLDAVTKSYKSLKKKYAKGIVSSQESKKAFDELKTTLVAQYQHNSDSSACTIIQDYINQYNLQVDSLQAMNVKVETPAEISERVMGAKSGEANVTNGKIVLANARQIDSKVARWLICHDVSERADLVRECQSIIRDTKLIINTLPQAQWGEVIKIFRQAEQYFIKTCR